MISFILLVGLVPPAVFYLSELFPTITEFILNLSNTAFYISTAIIIVMMFLISWMTTTIIYQCTAFLSYYIFIGLSFCDESINTLNFNILGDFMVVFLQLLLTLILFSVVLYI